MRDLLFYGGTIIFWIGLIGCYVYMKKLREQHPGTDYRRLRTMAKEGNRTAVTGLRLLFVAAFGVAIQLTSIVLYS